ncbi:MAG: NAD(P)H-hydrate epimerase [Candidatus Colwellbacteria bacterium]|nr:NAD(P)H-hydrate epimerase [Candidatus Colwellbacteria bacterium]
MEYATTKHIEELYAFANKNGLNYLTMLELGGWNTAIFLHHLQVARTFKIVVICGNDRKGTYGLSTAKHLMNHRWSVSVILVGELTSMESQYYLEILEKMGASLTQYQPENSHAQRMIRKCHVVLDALLGPNASKERPSLLNEAIEMVGRSAKRIISLEVPSGLDGSTGMVFPPVLRAEATLALGLPMNAFLFKEGAYYSGKVFVADIGLPKFVYDRFTLGIRPKFDAYPNTFLPLEEYRL